ncbi:glucan biosynthesis protein D [Methylobacterium sp. ARG-1]|uniref:glucan biosynthesis protein D n=1 Tax=Methylobacterium sp. ARG-1 TaxID=1692501 RepID=UPI000681708C|nr:glucan biosynthesis protein D [Methylobacterium sp. ARG-1]KNY20406.1 glucan biosynthesis protein D [Methylobacterium sp. ARG-1]
MTTAAGSAAVPTRRAVLAGAVGTAAGFLPAIPRAAEPDRGTYPATTLPGAGAPFEANTLADIARARAAAPYAAPRTDDVPAVLKGLSRDAYEAIHPVPGRAVWAGRDFGYEIEPLLRGSIFDTPVSLFTVENGRVQPLAYDKDSLIAANIALPELTADTAFSGFRLRARFSDGGDVSNFALFQGASFFRLVAEGQDFGINARALALRPADSRGEEFPLFRALFIEAPAPGQPIVVHALVESESATAAFKLTLTPGREASVAGIDGTVFARAELDHIGLGGMQGSYLFGPLDRQKVDDLRAAAFSVEGLSIRNGYGEPIWRPVHNPEALQVSAFLDRGPKGFGLMQRARAYDDFEDDRRHWEQRPSLWIEPQDDWSEGAVTLLEIPSDSELNENVFAYWRPKAKLTKGGEMRFLCRQHWSKGWPDPLPPELARVKDSRCGRGSTGTRRLFAVDFQGDGLARPEEIEVALSASAGTITRQDRFHYPERRTLRVLFELDPGSERASELRLGLRRGQDRASETWLFRWTP